MKILSKMFLLVCASNTIMHAQTIIDIDFAPNNKPEVNYKRGVAAPGQNGFFDSAAMRDFMDNQASIGMTMFNGIRNLFKDPETDEFYQENGLFKNRQITKFTDAVNYAYETGFELIIQAGGTPRNSGYEFDTSFYKGEATPDNFVPWTDFAPIPAEGESMSAFQENFTQWAINVDKSIGEDYHSIWIGTQEIAHTIGFKNGIENAENKELNVRRWISYWKPISDALRSVGAKTGGIQLNSSNVNIYKYAVDQMVANNLHLDYLTYQFYQYENPSGINGAVSALNEYNKVYPGTKIIVDRGGYGKFLPESVDDSSSRRELLFLKGEAAMMDQADHIYACTLDFAVNGINVNKDKLPQLTKGWLNKTGSIRGILNGLPANVGGFTVRSNDKLSIAIWNEGATTQNLSLAIKNLEIASSASLMAQQARDLSFIESNGVVWNSSNNTIENISLQQYDYILIDLTYGSSLSVEGIVSENVKVFPNPTNHMITVSGLKNKRCQLALMSLNGRTVKKQSNNNNTLNIESISKGVYVLKIETSTGKVVFKKISII